ncbi:YcnI family copper-binding membrane protein [Nocardia sp. IBHARD005]|uniref:YcnI family copper-binding membrane protein n=1 Tax=Nocardia sp. IBHARD005 TaxID=3457765 RepID=UPI00405909B0
MLPIPSRSIAHRLTVGATVLVIGALPAATASAHVTVSGHEATRGGSGVLNFRVPNESTTQSPTVALTVRIPKVTAVDTETVTGWRATVGKQPDGATEITWTADAGTGIGPDQFGEFSVLANGLPDTDRLVIPAIQTYADGTVVRWDQTPGADGTTPEYPAPTVTLRAGPAGTALDHGDIPDLATQQPSTDDTAARWLGGIGIALGALGLLTALGVAVRSRTS